MKRYADFIKSKEMFKSYTDFLSVSQSKTLVNAVKLLINKDYGGKYELSRPVVFNESLDNCREDADIKIILVGDNPGRREQETGLYLIGPSGKLAENFFSLHPSLGVDFRKNVLILNKTPIHTPRTLDLKKISKSDALLSALIRDSQIKMVSVLESFYKALAPVKIWVIGYSEMKKGGIFEEYTRALFEKLPRNSIYLYRHFSMNQFSIDFNKKKSELTQSAGQKSESSILETIGLSYREKIIKQLGIRHEM